MISPLNIDKSAPYSVLIIADHGVIDEHLTSALKNVQNVDLISHHATGSEGIASFRKRHIDVIIIDIGMENEDPLSTLGRLLRIDKHAKIIMASTLSFANVRQSMIGFERGAVEFINTPASFSRESNAIKFNTEVQRVVRSLGEARRQENSRTAPATFSRENVEIILRPPSSQQPHILAIGSSTGGPQALISLFTDLPANFPVPILVTQHMPKTFTAVLANTISTRTKKTVIEAKDGMPIEPNIIYIAPGDFHMTVTGSRKAPVISLNQNERVNFCRPSVDPMLESIVKIYGGNILVAILTGMGSDGKNGSKSVVAAGGTVIAQDAATSTVWGMPGAVATAGMCSQVLPINEIPKAISKIIYGVPKAHNTMAQKAKTQPTSKKSMGSQHEQNP